MGQSSEQISDSTVIEVRCYFVRGRNALLARAQFTDLFTDHYLHLMDNQIRHEPENDQLLKDALSAITLHMASRPRDEVAAWTINFNDPAVNVFASGSSKTGNVIARLSTENVKVKDDNIFHSQVVRDRGAMRQSSVAFQQHDVFHAVETYYHQSEQRPASFFHIGEEDFVMVSAQPDCDRDWFHALDEEQVRNMDQVEELSLLEKRQYQYRCGCNLDRIYPIIAGMSAGTLAHVFEGEETADASCPRCGARYRITREGLEAYISSQ